MFREQEGEEDRAYGEGNLGDWHIAQLVDDLRDDPGTSHTHQDAAENYLDNAGAVTRYTGFQSARQDGKQAACYWVQIHLETKSAQHGPGEQDRQTCAAVQRLEYFKGCTISAGHLELVTNVSFLVNAGALLLQPVAKINCTSAPAYLADEVPQPNPHAVKCRRLRQPGPESQLPQMAASFATSRSNHPLLSRNGASDKPGVNQ